MTPLPQELDVPEPPSGDLQHRPLHIAEGRSKAVSPVLRNTYIERDATDCANLLNTAKAPGGQTASGGATFGTDGPQAARCSSGSVARFYVQELVIHHARRLCKSSLARSRSQRHPQEMPAKQRYLPA